MHVALKTVIVYEINKTNYFGIDEFGNQKLYCRIYITGMYNAQSILFKCIK